MSEAADPSPNLGQTFGGKPYAPSWINRLSTAIEKLPGPPWAYYLGLTLAEALLNHSLRWLDGSLPRGTFDLFRLAEAPFFPYMLAVIYYLGRTATSSLESFRPALVIGENDYARIRYELTTMPAAQGRIAVALGIAAAILNIRATPAGYGVSDAISTVTYAYILAYASFTSAVGFAFFFYIARQLWLVNRIHHAANKIDLFESLPLHSFSRLTVRAGLAVLIMVYYLFFFVSSISLQVPAARITPLDMGILAMGNLIAIGSFVLPLYGMHVRLARERSRMIARSNRRFRASVLKLHEAVDTDDLEKMDALNKAMASLIIERDTLARIST